MSEYEPGTVAMVRRVFMRDARRALRIGSIGWHLRPCTDEEESDGSAFVLDKDVADVRPLVVIDPEDRETVERLARASHDAIHKPGDFDSKTAMSREVLTDLMQAALREFANPTPPKPPEPTGLGAVVEDADGVRWVRASQYVTSHRNDWYREAGTSTGSDRRHYDAITAVRVLSEGVTDA